ncbi:hypothetical protein I4U23_011114 [Adineta vaga]|nr:hypothetical protein I4U23_011114 [Adineta vaga]
MNSDDAVFRGFAGGYDSVPGIGNVPPSTGGFEGTRNIPVDAHTRVDPSHFSGIVHWGPKEVVSGEIIQTSAIDH